MSDLILRGGKGTQGQNRNGKKQSVIAVFLFFVFNIFLSMCLLGLQVAGTEKIKNK